MNIRNKGFLIHWIKKVADLARQLAELEERALALLYVIGTSSLDPSIIINRIKLRICALLERYMLYLQRDPP